jgi:putative drug exporter of the RND superfamily
VADPFGRLSTFVVQRRWVVLAVWVLILVAAGAVFAPRATTVVKGGGFSVPGSDSVVGAQILERDLKMSPDNAVIVVYRSRGHVVTDPVFRRAVTHSVQRITRLSGIASAVDYFQLRDPSLVGAHGHVTAAILAVSGNQGQAQKRVPGIRDQLRGLPVEHYVTGKPAIDEDTFKSSERDVSRSELFTIPVVIILLLLVFRTAISALLPVVLGACSVLLSQALIYFLGSAFDMSIFALNVSSMIGLGLGIDFSLMVVSRLRSEVAAGREREEAIAIAMATAGRSITYSAITVMLSMLILTLVVFQLMIVRSISLAVILVAFTALAAGLTLLPALLSILGHRIEWAPVLPRRKILPSISMGFWYRLSRRVMKNPWLWLIGSLVFLGLLALPVRNLKMAAASPGSLPPATESVRGYNLMKQTFGESTLTPIQIVVQATPGGVWTPEFLRSLRTLSERVAADPRVAQVRSLWSVAHAAGMTRVQFSALTAARVKANPRFATVASQFADLHGANDVAVVTAISKYGQFDNRQQQLVTDLRDSIIPGLPQLGRYRVLVTGTTPTFLDFQSQLYGRFPIIVGAVMLMIFIILMMFFQSFFLPIKAMLMNLVTVLATYGVLVLIFQDGFGTGLLGFTSQGLLGNITPAVLFVILFGLSTDYEVFLLSRVKESYREIGDNDESVARGLQSTAGVITAAGLILVGTFGSFATASVLTIKEIGLGLAIGVALDTTIVRVIMVPATMKLMGDWNWWMPSWLQRIVPELSEGPSARVLAEDAAVH